MSRLKTHLETLKDTIIDCLINDDYTALNKLYKDEYVFNKGMAQMLLSSIENISKICELRGRY